MAPAVTDCNGCGSCCDPVVLPFAANELVGTPLWLSLDRRTRTWLTDDLERIPYRDGLSKSPWLAGRDTAHPVTGEPTRPVFYWCRLFDRDTRTCLGYEQRPGICAEHPWGGELPKPSAALPDWCSYQVDVGRPVTAVPVELLPSRPGG